MFLAVLSAASCLPAGVARARQAASDAAAVSLTAEERNWLEAHPDIELGFTEGFEPEVIVNPDGTYRGIQVDVLDELSRRLGTRIRLRIDPISQLIAKAQNRETAGILNIIPENADKLGLLATKGYMTSYAAVFARTSVAFDRPTDLAGRKVAIVDRVLFSEMIVERYGAGATVLRVKDVLEGLRCVDNGEVDFFLGTSKHVYLISKYQLYGLARQFVYYDHPFKCGMGVRSDWPILVTILDKGLSHIGTEGLRQIETKWIQKDEHRATVTLTEEEPRALKLATEEEAWLARNHTVRVRVVDFPPYIVIKEGRITGMVIDYVNLISERTGVRFELVPETRPWQEALESLMNLQGPDMITSVSPMAEREPYMAFSDAYIVSPRVIFTRTDGEFVSGMGDLRGRTVAAPRGTLVHKRIEAEYPAVRLLSYGSDSDSIEAVATGVADAYIGNLVNASYRITRRGLTNVKVAAPCPFADDVYTFGIRRDWLELRSLVNKALGSMTAEEHGALRSKYLTVRYEHGVSRTDVLKWSLGGGAVVACIVLGFVLWNRSLARLVDERTARIVEGEARFRATFEQAAVGIAHVSPEGRFLIVNRRYCDIVGYTRGQLLGRTFQEITHPDDLDTDVGHSERLLRGEAASYAMEKRYIRRDREAVWVQLTVSLARNDAGEPEFFVAVVEDITERRHVENARQESEEKLERLMEQSPASIQIHRPDGKLQRSNAAFGKLYALNEEMLTELREKYNVLHDEQAVRLGVMPYIQRVFAGEEVRFPPYEYNGMETLETLDVKQPVSRTCWVRTLGYPLVDNEGKVQSVVLISEDITEQQRGERELRQYQERLRALASELTMAEEKERKRLAADLHDEVGQRLALARVQLAVAARCQADTGMTPILKEVSESLLHASGETRRLISDLSSPAIRELGLDAAISEWLTEHIGDRYGLEAAIVSNLDDRQVDSLSEGKRSMMFRNVRELVTNVIKHARAKRIAIDMKWSERALRIVVEDDGIGFDRDVTVGACNEGGGFGLFSIRERMTDIGGSLEVVTGPGRGCKAILTAPLGGPVAQAPPA